MAFYLDDVPPEPFTIEPPETIDLAEFSSVEASIIAPDGVVTPLIAIIDVPENAIIVTQPTPDSVFTVEGIHRLRLAVIDAAPIPYRQALPEVRIVAQDHDSEWHTLDSARGEWADAEHLSDAVLYQLLADVREQVLAFAPALFDAEGAPLPVPARYRRGQLVQARNTLNAQGVDPANGEDGNDTFAIRPFPLDWQVKQILRPKHGIPVVR